MTSSLSPRGRGCCCGGGDVAVRVVDEVGKQLQLRDGRHERDEVRDATGERDLAHGVHQPPIGPAASLRSLPVRWCWCLVLVLVVMSCSLRSGWADRVCWWGGPKTSGRPRSPSLRSSPWSADWSATGPWMTVVPSSWAGEGHAVEQGGPAGARCPGARISYRSDLFFFFFPPPQSRPFSVSPSAGG